MEDEKKRREILFPFLTWIWLLGIQIQESSPTFGKVSKLE